MGRLVGTDKGRDLMQRKYLDIKAYLLKQIETGAYRVDEPIPPERELAASLGVNRMTLRRAVEELMYEGLLIRKKGSGTFLTKTKVSKAELLMTSEGEKKDAIKVISCRSCQEGSYGYQMLGLDPTARRPYWRLRRLRMMEMIPYAYEDIYFGPDFFSTVDGAYHHLGLHQIVRERADIPDVMVSETVEALLCLHNTAVLLNVKEGSPILQIKSTFESEGRIVLHCRSYHPGDNYSYHGSKRPVGGQETSNKE